MIDGFMVRTFRSSWALLLPDERRTGLFLLGLMIVGMGLEALGVGLVLPVLAVLSQHDLASKLPIMSALFGMMGNPSQPTMIVLGMLVLAVVYLIKGAFLTYLAWHQTRFIYRVQSELSSRAFSSYLRQPYSFHLRRNSAELIQNVIGEINLFTFNVVAPGMNLAAELLVFAGLAAVLFLVEPAGALALITILASIGWSFYRITRVRVERWGRERQYHDSWRIQHVQQGFGGIKDIKLLGREENFVRQYDIHNQLSSRAGRLQATIQQLPRLWMESLAVVSLAILVTTVVAQGRGVGDLLATLGVFLAAAFRLMPSANRILVALQSLRYGVSVIETLSSELQSLRPDAPPSYATATSRVPFECGLQLDALTFCYDINHPPEVTDVSLEVRKGEMIGIIGTSGAGKSTLVDLILGILPPTTGVVTVDGKSIHTNLSAWQSQIGYVSQTIYLTDDTILRNIAFGLADEEIDEASVWRALRSAQLDDFVQSLPDKLDTIVGERGVRLSGGQRQRIGIARALYRDPPILVLDEATSSLDVVTEMGVMESVQSLHGKKTVIIVAHRTATVEKCDRVYRLDSGRIVGQGSPAEVLAK
jgi:ABC-type multidrug transport system fused ATPase/permease subunit